MLILNLFNRLCTPKGFISNKHTQLKNLSPLVFELHAQLLDNIQVNIIILKIIYSQFAKHVLSTNNIWSEIITILVATTKILSTIIFVIS